VNLALIPVFLVLGTAVGFMAGLFGIGGKQRVLRRGGFRVLRDAASPGPVDLDAYCARPHVLVTPRGDLAEDEKSTLEGMGRRRQVVLGLPDFGMLSRVLRGSDLLCTVADALADAVLGRIAELGLASDPAPFPCPESVVRMAWRAVLDHDPAEAWLRAQIVETLAGPH